MGVKTPEGQECMTVGELKRLLENVDDASRIRVAMSIPDSDRDWFGYVVGNSTASIGSDFYILAEGEYRL